MPTTAQQPREPSPPARVLVFAVLVVGLAIAGTATAYHLSAGARDAAALEPEETPGEPSVSPAMHERGTRTDCYEPDPADPDPVQAAGSDAFCGRLVYEAGTIFEQIAPPDQRLPSGSVGTFDVVYASYVGTYGIGTCAPWCFPGGEPVYRGLHDVGAQAGLTEEGEDAYESDQGWQTYGTALAVPNALATLGGDTGAWEADGWVHPIPDQRFVAFLEDDRGVPIDDERLARLVAEDDGLHLDALPRVCGFTPDADLATPEAAPGCEVPFRWQGPGEGTSGGDACASPTYACGTVTAAWHARVVCSAALPGCSQTPDPDPRPTTPEFAWDDPSASTNDYDLWHWVVAPTPSACQGAQEPGFDVAPQGAGRPFLAHDLDVHAPLATAGEQRGTENVERLARTLVDRQPAPLPEEEPAIPGPEQATLVAKDDRVEPNAPGDTSQTRIAVPRDAEDDCRRILATTESPDLVDPWVDLVDANVYRNLWLDSILGVDPWLEGLDRRTYQKPPITSVFGDANDAYLTTDERQDASNRPGPWMYSAGGKLGVFADKDDDGRYDQAPNSRLFEAIEPLGAYPLFWDVRVDETGSIDPDAGCRLGAEGTRLSHAMQQAGYGPRTGLLMVVYKAQATVLYEWRTSQTFPQPLPGQAYVLLSQSLHAQREDPAVQDAIQAALDRVPGDLGPEDREVVYPGDQIDPASDFYEQCGYPTGGFHTSWSFVHAAPEAQGATLVTGYLLDNQAAEGELGTEGPIPAFEPHGEAYSFPDGLSAWFDVDPIDGDPDRNTDACSAPPHDGDRC